MLGIYEITDFLIILKMLFIHLCVYQYMYILLPKYGEARQLESRTNTFVNQILFFRFKFQGDVTHSVQSIGRNKVDAIFALCFHHVSMDLSFIQIYNGCCKPSSNSCFSSTSNSKSRH